MAGMHGKRRERSCMHTAVATHRDDFRVSRLIIVILLSLLSISMWAPDLRRAFGHPIGLGDYHGADLSGAVPDARDTPLTDRMRLLFNKGCWQPSPGIPCDFAALYKGRVVHIRMKTVPEPAENGIIVLMRCAVAFLWLLAAGSLVLLRPSPATWAFFAMALYGLTPDNIFTEIGPPWWQVAATGFVSAWERAMECAALIFALYLLQPETLPGWRRIALGVAYALVIAALALGVAEVVGVAMGSQALLDFSMNSIVPNILAYLPTYGAPLLLLVTYIASNRRARERIRWVLAGFVVGAIAIGTSSLALQVSYFYYSLCFVIYVFAITGSTMYAVLRHRIIDVNVILSRTVVYTLLSGLVVALFAIVDLFFTKTLSESNTGLVADVVLALVLGFFLNTMHHRLDRFVDGIVFRKRYLAQKHVALVADSARHAPTIEALNGMMIDEPARALGLTFGALARCVDDDDLEVVFSTLPDLQDQMLASTSRLTSYLRAESRSVRLRDHYWQSDAFLKAGVEAAIAIPVFSHDDLAAVAFYGWHRTATELDGEEIELLERVAKAAGLAYDRLRSRALEAELIALKLQHAV